VRTKAFDLVYGKGSLRFRRYLLSSEFVQRG
jgi:hypothetical protein